jgi:hypothetical protein
MKFRDDKKSAYLTGYAKTQEELSISDELIKSANGAKWQADWEKSGEKKLNSYSDDLIRSGNMYTNSETLFRYSLNDVVTMYEDPTWLGFKILFDGVNSPLFNYGDFPPVAIEKTTTEPKKSVEEVSADLPAVDLTAELTTSPNTVTKTTEPKIEQTDTEKKASEAQSKKTEYSNAPYVSSSALSFIRKYGYAIPEIQKRESIYYECIENLDVLFNRTDKVNGGYTKDYYIEQITGLDKLPAKMVKYEEDKITIQLTEDVSLRSSYLAELYNNLIYSYKNQRYLIPENCLRFDMDISITDMRVFKYLITDNNGNLTEKINFDPPRITYTLHDCNFDFSKSIPFQPAMIVGGRNQGAPAAHSILSFDIKYKSISKNFRTSLIRSSLEISNKLDQLVNSQILTKSEVYKHDIISQYGKNIKSEQEKFSNSENLESETQQIPINPNESLGKTKDDTYFKSLNFKRKESLEDFAKGVGNQLLDTAIDNVDGYVDKLKAKYNDIRGQLLNDMLRQIREPLNLPRIYPNNVYSTDFRSLSLETFARGLGSDLLNDLLCAASSGLLGATNI